MAPSAYRPGKARCANCKKWKAEKAFVRSFVKRGTKIWKREGFVWHRFATCNRCSRMYSQETVMSVEEFIEDYGAEEHDDSEPELDTENREKEGKDKRDARQGGSIAALPA